MTKLIRVEGNPEEMEQFIHLCRDINLVGLKLIHHRMRSTMDADANKLSFYDVSDNVVVDYPESFKKAQI